MPRSNLNFITRSSSIDSRPSCVSVSTVGCHAYTHDERVASQRFGSSIVHAGTSPTGSAAGADAPLASALAALPACTARARSAVRRFLHSATPSGVWPLSLL